MGRGQCTWHLRGSGNPSRLEESIAEIRCPSADEWIRKLWCIYTIENYSAIKKNTFASVLMRWMKLEPIIQSVPRKKNTNTYTYAYIWNLERW